MRFETHRVSEYLIRLLQFAPPVRQVLTDGGDIIEIALVSGETVSLHLIQSDIALNEAKQILRENGERGVYTLFLFWRDMLLPDHGHVLQMDRWLAAWSELYGGKVYGYDFNGADIYLFPVHFDSVGVDVQARFGLTIDPSRLVVREVYATGTLPGHWRVAAFDGDTVGPVVFGLHSLDACYALLELEPGSSRLLVKRAYRRLARRLHPDVNPSSDAHQQMQALNDAYRTLLEHLANGAATSAPPTHPS